VLRADPRRHLGDRRSSVTLPSLSDTTSYRCPPGARSITRYSDGEPPDAEEAAGEGLDVAQLHLLDY
jgi:hypothetical protein